MTLVATGFILLGVAALVSGGADLAGFGFVAIGWGKGGLVSTLVLVVRSSRQ